MQRKTDACRVSTGILALDGIIDDLRIGDNVVWRVDDLEDYQRHVSAFVEAAKHSGRQILYIRFGAHRPLLTAAEGVTLVELDALQGFETFTAHVYELITRHGRGAFYVFDCLSDLLSDWATDRMVGYLFEVVCPYLYELDTVAYFALLARRHSHDTISRIRRTTQVLIDVRRHAGGCHIQPVKADQRRSPTMFLPHEQQGEQLIPITDSSAVTRTQAAMGLTVMDAPMRQLDYWDALFLEAQQVASEEPEDAHQPLIERLCRMLLGRDERIQSLAQQHFRLADLLAIRARMIGSGFIGGKAVGMLLARRILIVQDQALWDQHLAPEDAFFLGTDAFYAFIVHNRLWHLLMQHRQHEHFHSAGARLHAAICAGTLPEGVRQALPRVLDYFGQYPILVRSSSLLEDGFGNAFAGKYDSLFLVNQGPPEERLAALEQAILQVYASSVSADALSYRDARGLAECEEPMALLIQRVNGSYQDRYYLPDAAGVAVSRNIFAWHPDLNPAAGMLRLVMGLGTRAVDRQDGDHAAIIPLDAPTRRPYSDAEEARRYSQHLLDALDVERNSLVSLSLRELLPVAPGLETPLNWLGSLDTQASVASRQQGGPLIWHLDFAKLLNDSEFVPLMRRLLSSLEQAYKYPVDVEFTVHIDADGAIRLNLVQCRPLQTLGQQKAPQLPQNVASKHQLMATRGQFMGGNIEQPIARVIRVDGQRYAALDLSRKYAVARLIGRLNAQYASAQDCPTLLIGPGRWGSSTPSLGVPIRFSDISRMTALVEVAELGDQLMPDLSYGSHFFQDLVESRIAYIAIRPGHPCCDYYPQWLEQQPGAKVSLDPEDGIDAQVAGAVQVRDTRDSGLKLMADVVSQQLLCAAVIS
ncbi:Pyruvate phosphate dikinase, PEP/pyruvate binding domain [Ectothiorhodosinus mongolicus]|uniref:Phosphoenolpyruvate synthase n=1 Tax=Ectothiorhodosinus mongolicus TaxID=233100 RepID=A0A1R3W5S1_9GAMM|nr:PEP/pyruvate-binding domain-containing protein [Ectothiorhodosinus mongolicus]ULX58020.1 phosphoenolpyruvate synthase [Ectothiorhodosinus mongolicus]SIT72925.1 Pyruvate phosphate dikinase, PEP/pyruvate binding domain [Ectothiorhodosinus mongolicus]